MIELLLAMTIIGVAALSILVAFATSINGTGVHRNLATFDTVLRTASAEVTGDIQQQSAAAFANCSGAYQINTTPGSIPLPTNYSATITSVGYWNGSGYTNPQTPVGTGCPAGTLLNTLGNFYSSQQVTVTVTKTGSSGPTSSSITTVVVDPTSPNSSGAPPCQYGPYQLAWVQQPTTGPAGAALFPVPSVAVEDKTGCIIQSDASPVTLAITSGTGTAGASLNNCATSLNYGTTVFSGCSIGVPGNGYTLTASDPTDGLAAVTSGPFNITNGVPAQLVFQTEPGGGTGGTPWISANQPTVWIEDSQGHLVTSDQSTVTLAIGNNPGNGTLSGCSSATAVNGVATFTGCTIDKAGTGYTLTATDAADSLNVPVASTPFNIAVGPPSQVAFTTQPGNAVAGDKFATPPAVAVEDAGGNVVTTATNTVSLAIGTNPSSGSLSGCTGALNSGVTTFSGCTINNAGTGYTLVASASGLTPTATSTPFNVVAPQLTSFSLTTPGSVTAGSAFTASITALDQLGYTYTGLNGSQPASWSGTATNAPHNWTPTLPSSVTFASGVASGSNAPSLTLVNAQSGATLTFTSNGVSGSTSLTITPDSATVTSFTVTGSPVTYGAETSLSFSAAVTAGGNGMSIPNGDTVAVTRLGTPLCTITLSSGSGSCSPSSGTVLGAGSYTATATFNASGSDPNFVTTATNTTPVTVNAAATTTSVTSSANPSVVGQAVTYTATVAANPASAGTPTGNVEFLDGGTAIAACGGASGNPLSGASATCVVSYGAVGSHTITAKYLGSTNFSASAVSSSITQTVNAAATTTAVASNHNPSVVGQAVTYTATVAVSAPGSGTPPSSDTVTFKDGASTISCGTGSVAFNGTTATCVVTYASTTGSPHSVTAVFGGDANYAGSTSSTLTQTVNKAATTTSLTSTSNPSVVGQQVFYTATVAVSAPGAGTPSGSDTVTFKDGASTISCGSGSTAFNGTLATCSATYNTTTGSPHSITAVFGGDANYAGSTSPALNQTVNQAATTTSVTSTLNPSTVGQQVTYAATVAVTAPGAGAPSGSDTVTFKDGATTLSCGSGSTAFNGTTATCVVTPTTAGSHSITAAFGGDANYSASTSSALSQTVNAASTTTSVASNHNPSVVGQAVTYTATVAVTAPGSGTPSNTDTVTFKDGASTISCGTGSVAFNGTTATCVATPTTAGSHSITAVFNGDANFATSTSSALSQTVNAAATTTAVASSANPSVVGQAVTYTAMVAVTAPGAGTPSNSDTMTFKDGASTISCGTGSVAFNGTSATCVVTSNSTTGSPHSITAVFGGDANYAGSTSSTLTQTVNKAATTTAVASSANPSVVGQAVTYTATVAVSAPGAGTPANSDTVTFKDGASTISCGTGSVSFNGTSATCVVTYNSTTGSPHSITAVFGGDANYSTSTSSALSQSVYAAPTVTTGSATGISRTRATVNGTVNPQGDSDTVQFCYSATASQVTSTSCTGTLVTASASPATGTSPVSENAQLTGLTRGTRYYYDLVVTSSGGAVTYGTPANFTTNP
jgi:Bacterial Ig-like domain (group 3)